MSPEPIRLCVHTCDLDLLHRGVKTFVIAKAPARLRPGDVCEIVSAHPEMPPWYGIVDYIQSGLGLQDDYELVRFTPRVATDPLMPAEQ